MLFAGRSSISACEIHGNEKLAKLTSISVSRKDQIISVAVEDREPRRAADMANAYVQMLDKINRTVNITAGHRKRVFLENRLKNVKKDLAKAETGIPGNNPLKKSNPGKENSNLFIPFNKMPALGLELMRLMRGAKIQEKVFELMTTQFELAKKYLMFWKSS